MPENLLSGCAFLNTLMIPDGIETIASCAFSGCSSLKTVILGSRLRELAPDAFSGCTSLSGIYVSPMNSYFADSNGVVLSADRTQLLLYPCGKAPGAFSLCSLQSVSIPSSTYVAADAFGHSPQLTIYGENGSSAAAYAEMHDLRFIDLSTDIPVTGLTLPGTLTLAPGETRTLSAALTPDDTTETTLTWSSSDASIVSVSPDGVVSARHTGTASITATAANGSSAVCLVTVAAPVIQPEQIVLSADTFTLTPGEIRVLSASPLPSGAASALISWKSSDASVAYYTGGCLFALECGTATLTASIENGLSASCTITVVPAFGTPDWTLPSSLTRIEEEAFLALPVTVVSCPNGLQSIGARAFAGCTAFCQIRIPASVTFIADNAFDGCTQLIIYGQAGSSAQTFAEKHGYRFYTE